MQRALLVLIGCFGVGIGAGVIAPRSSTAETPAALLPYVPTRIEWAALFIQIHAGPNTVMCLPDEERVLCTILVFHTASAVDVELQRKLIDSAATRLRADHSWPWLKVVTETQIMKN